MADKKDGNQALREEWEGAIGRKASIKREIELGAYFLTPEPWLTWAYSLLAKGAVSKKELLDSMKIGAEYYKSKESFGELGWKTRVKRADEVLKQLRKKDATEVMGYKLPELGDIMLIESGTYVGFCTEDAAKQYFPKKDAGPKREIHLPTIAEQIAGKLEIGRLKESPPGLYLFPKMRSAR